MGEQRGVKATRMKMQLSEKYRRYGWFECGAVLIGVDVECRKGCCRPAICRKCICSVIPLYLDCAAQCQKSLHTGIGVCVSRFRCKSSI